MILGRVVDLERTAAHARAVPIANRFADARDGVGRIWNILSDLELVGPCPLGPRPCLDRRGFGHNLLPRSLTGRPEK